MRTSVFNPLVVELRGNILTCHATGLHFSHCSDGGTLHDWGFSHQFLFTWWNSQVHCLGTYPIPSFPSHSSHAPNSLKPSYTTETPCSTTPLQHPPGPIQSTWKWRQHIALKPQNNQSKTQHSIKTQNMIIIQASYMTDNVQFLKLSVTPKIMVCICELNCTHGTILNNNLQQF